RLVQRLVFAIIYYFLSRALIVKFNLKTPGREDEDESQTEGARQETSMHESGKRDFSDMAAEIYDGLGGDDNVISIDYCTSRLRLEYIHIRSDDEKLIIAAGVRGRKFVGNHRIQEVVRAPVHFVADEMIKIRNE